MTSSNLAQLYYVTESTVGTTPGSPNMKRVRFTSESLKIDQTFEQSEEITGDRIIKEFIPVGIGVSGGINWELSHGGFFDDAFESAMLSTFTKMPERDNDGTADSVITGVTSVDDTFTFADTGADFAQFHLVRTTGFTESANNSLFTLTSGSGTTAVIGAGGTLTDEAAPAADARIKVIGFAAASAADVQADATGLVSTTTDFTTFGLTVGQWLKIGGSNSANKFATTANNTFVRVKSIAANDLDFDYLPSGWSTDAAAGVTLYVFTSDYIEVGSTIKSFSMEKVFTGQGTPDFISYAAIVMNGLNIQADAQSRLTGSFDVIGFTGAESTTALDASPAAAPTNLIMNTSTNIGRLLENGSDQASPVWIESASLGLNNNLLPVTALANKPAVDYISGDAALTVNLSASFGNKDIYERFLDNTDSSFAFAASRNGKGYVFDVHSMTYTDGNVAAGGRNQRVNAEMTAQGKQHSTSGKMFAISEFEEFQS